MYTTPIAHQLIGRRPRDLGDGLILRSARQGDGSELADFNAAMHADADMAASTLADWTRDLFESPHPTFRAERDVTVVEDSATGRIVSALFLIPQFWSYAGVPMAVGQPELIATHPAYRRRGLVRSQFGVVHEWSRAAGHLWQFISGIPWYYRQFGYAYAIDLPSRPVHWLGENAPAASTEYSLRAATPTDVAFLAEIEAQATSGTALGPTRGPEGFALELARRPGALTACKVLVVESHVSGAQPVGYVAHHGRLRDGLVSVRAFELRRGQHWLGPTAAVVFHLHVWVRSHPDGPGRGIRFALPDGHPAIRSAATRLGSGPPGTYALYVRVPDVIAVLRAVASVLESRLAASPADGWTGDLRIDLYNAGIHLHFEEGRLELIEPWVAPDGDGVNEPGADASLRLDEFVPLLVGNRSVHDLERATADFLVHTDTGALLLDVLFPAMPTSTWEFC